MTAPRYCPACKALTIRYHTTRYHHDCTRCEWKLT